MSHSACKVNAVLKSALKERFGAMFVRIVAHISQQIAQTKTKLLKIQLHSHSKQAHLSTNIFVVLCSGAFSIIPPLLPVFAVCHSSRDVGGVGGGE